MLLLLLLNIQLREISGFQQSPASVTFARRQISSRHLSTIVSPYATETSDISHLDYDWDEQFEELQSFMSTYGHCNFPQNPSKELQQKYPMSDRFCHDMRREYKQLQRNKIQNKRMSIPVFDRHVRCRRLEEIGFEFSFSLAPWYDRYHDLLEHFNEYGNTRATKIQNEPLAQWIYQQRLKRSEKMEYRNLSESQIRLLDAIGFEWESELYDEKWNEKYQELRASRDEDGNFVVDHASPLYDWMHVQRERRAGKKGRSSITDEQVRLLDEIGFSWKADRYDSNWYAMYSEVKDFQNEYGRFPEKKVNEKLYSWVKYQQDKHQRGLLTSEQVKLLVDIGIEWERNKHPWPTMFVELTEYYNKHGHLQVNREDNQELFDWMELQRKTYHGMSKRAMSDEQIEKLEELHFCWSLDWRDRTWHEKYTEAVEYFKEKGHLLVTKKENDSLYNWIQTQDKRYKEVKGQKPLSAEELEMLEQVDFPFLEGQPRMAWNSVYSQVVKYRQDIDGRLPTKHKDDPDLSRWIRHQQHRYRSAYGYAPLSDEQKQLLEAIDFPMYPVGRQRRQWYEKYDQLVDFRKKHGHFLVDRSKDSALYKWILKQRSGSKGSSIRARSLTRLEEYLMERIGFTWTSDRYEVEWQQNYQEIVEFLEAHGRFPRNSENRKLFRWTLTQRQRYKGKGSCCELSESEIQQLEKIGFQWSLRNSS